jgi:uncharacterized protein involved in response to NO
LTRSLCKTAPKTKIIWTNPHKTKDNDALRFKLKMTSVFVKKLTEIISARIIGQLKTRIPNRNPLNIPQKVEKTTKNTIMLLKTLRVNISAIKTQYFGKLNNFL